MSPVPLRIALVILEDKSRRVAFQLRSNLPGIVNPDQWGLFGGHIEDGETPAGGALREVEEELSCTLQPGKLRYLADEWRGAEKRYFLFHYPLTEELDNVRLTEGQRFAFFSLSQIREGVVGTNKIVSYHRDWILNFWDTRKT